MISMNVKCIKVIDCVWDFVRIFLALIVALVPKDIALAPIQDHAKVIQWLNWRYFGFYSDFLIDIDECKETPNVCPRQDDVCTNLRGSHRCIPINCPYGYMRDPDRKK